MAKNTSFMSVAIKSAALLAYLALATTSSAAATYVTGTQMITPSYGLTPAKGETRTEPTTGLEIKRVSLNTELSPVSQYGLTVYSRYSPTNTTGEYVLVHHVDSTSCSLYRTSDNKNMGVLKRTSTNPIGEVNEIRWDYTGRYPNRVYFVYGTKFYQMDVLNSNGTPTLIRDFAADFPGAVKIMNGVEGDSSIDSRYWAWQVLGPYANGSYPRMAFMVYDRATDKIVSSMLPSSFGKTYLPAPNMVEMSPLGTKVILHYGTASTHPCTLNGTWVNIGNGVWELNSYKTLTAGNNSFSVVTANGVPLQKMSTSSGASTSITGDYQYANNSTSNKFWIRLTLDANPNGQVVVADWGKRPEDVGTVLDGPKAFDLDFTNPVVISVNETHSGWAWDAKGRELFVSQNNKEDWIETRDILTGETIKILQHGADLSYSNGFHFSKFYNRNLRGWLLMNTTSKTNTNWSENQVLMVEIKPKADKPIIWRISPKYSAYAGSYRDESPVALGFDGMSVWYTSNWGTVSGSGDVYKTTLPADWYTHFPGPLHPTPPGPPTGAMQVK